MQRTLLNILAIATLAASTGQASAFSWDPIGDIQNPGRIVNNIKREAGNAGKELDRIRLEGQAQAGAPIFEAWLNQSRNDAASGAMPIPAQVRQQLQGFYDEGILNRARFKIGDPGVFNLANLSIRYGDAAAVTLRDIIVFKSANDAYNNPILWAHELKHVQQFASWGVRDFAIRYLRSWNSVEHEAHAAEDAFINYRRQQAQQQPQYQQQVGFNQPGMFPRASACFTNLGACPMAVSIPGGSPCYCPTYAGLVWGVAR